MDVNKFSAHHKASFFGKSQIELPSLTLKKFGLSNRPGVEVMSGKAKVICSCILGNLQSTRLLAISCEALPGEYGS